jgi:S1-C subfamily serine protease
VTALDWLLIAWVALWALLGAARGMTEQVLSLAGLAIGAAAGSRLAPFLLPDGRESVWLPLVALGTAIAGALIVQAILLRLAAPLRRRVGRDTLRRVDQAGGLVVGAAIGLALAWLAGAVALYQPGDRATGIREQVQRSSILSAALRAVPPDRLLGALARIDPFPVIPLPAEALPPPDESVLMDPVALRARGSVVQVRGRACGLVKQGSGWVVGDGLVATNAHVIAGQDDTSLIPPGGPSLAAEPVFVDARNDVALLRVPGLGLRPLRLGDAPVEAQSVVLMGYPNGGPLVAEAATAAPPRTVIAPDAYGGDTGPRSVVVTRGSLGPGSSGGPIVDRDGEVIAMIFGGSPDGESGAAVTPGPIRRGLESPLRPVDSGPCA